MKFRHAYKNQENFYQEFTDCDVKAAAAGYGGLHRRTFIERCMAGGGWERYE
jgi:hypothetical protein